MLTWNEARFAFGLIVAVLVCSWMSYPLKRVFGILAHPPLLRLKFNREFGTAKGDSQLFSVPTAELVEVMSVLFLDYLIVSFVFAFAVGGGLYIVSTRLSGFENYELIRLSMSAAFLFGLFITAYSRISVMQFSTWPIRSLFFVLIATVGMVVCSLISQLDLMTLITDRALKGAYIEFAGRSLILIVIALVSTELIIYLNRRVFEIANVIPLELFFGLGQLFQERRVIYGEQEIARTAIEIVRARVQQAGIRSIRWITVDCDSELVALLKERAEQAPEEARNIRIIAPPETSQELGRALDGIGEIRVCPSASEMRYTRCLIVNGQAGVVYQRIPPRKGCSANVGQLVDDCIEVHTLAAVFDSWYESLSRDVQR